MCGFFYYYTVNNGRNYSYNSNHDIYNNNCNFIISYKFKTFGFLVLICSYF